MALRASLIILIAAIGCSDDASIGPPETSFCLSTHLTTAPAGGWWSFSGSCFGRSLPTDAASQVPCVLVEATQVPEGACSCAPEAGRIPVSPEHASIVDEAREASFAPRGGWSCFCEIPQLSGASLAACRTAVDEPDGVSGWCFLDGDATQETNPELLEQCPASDQHWFRFVGKGEPAAPSTVFVTCCS